MNILENTIDVSLERWDDPGDYPNGCAGGPLPSFDYIEITGSLLLETNGKETISEIIQFANENWYTENIGEIKVKKWDIHALTERSNVLELTIREIEDTRF